MIHLSRLCVLVCVLAVSGCASHFDARFNRGVGLNDQEVLVVPFRESAKHKWYAESERGKVIATTLKQWAFQNATGAHFAEGEAAKQTVERVRDWTGGKEITPKDWKTLTSGLGVKFVLDGNLLALQESRPGAVNYYDGLATAHYRVIDVHQGRLAYEGEVTVRFGGNERGTPRFTSEFDDAGVIEARLLVLVGERIGQECYGYEEE